MVVAARLKSLLAWEQRLVAFLGLASGHVSYSAIR
jgi:hypothetical protein